MCPICGKGPGPSTNELAWDDHISLCTQDGIQATRHNHLQNTIRQEAMRRGQPSELATVVKEGKPGLITDLLFTRIPGRNGTTAVVTDISIVSPLARTWGIQPSVPLSAAALCEARKKAKYDKDCRKCNLDFRPIVFESTAAWGQSARDFFAVLLANSCTNARETATESDFAKLMSVIAVSLHRSMGEKFEAAVFRTTATGTA